MAKSRMRIVAPSTEKRTVIPKRRPNADLRTREYLTDREVEMLAETAKTNRWGHRDATMILVAYRHGLRASELVDLRWDQIDFDTATLAVRRARKARLARIRFAAMNCGGCGDCSMSKSRSRPSCLPRSAAHRSARPALRAWSSALAWPLTFGFKAASPCHGRRAGQQGARYVGPAGLPGPQEYSAHGALHRAVARSLQVFLALSAVVRRHLAYTGWGAMASGRAGAHRRWIRCVPVPLILPELDGRYLCLVIPHHPRQANP